MEKENLVEENSTGVNIDEDGMEYFGMFTEINGKVVYQTVGE